MLRVLITGGTRGIGRATVELMAATADTEVVFSYCQQESAAAELVDLLAARGAKVSMMHLDLRHGEDCQKKVEGEIESRGGFSAVVHNAAMTSDTPFYFMTPEQWQDVINTSLNSFYYINRACLPHMVRQRKGRIVTLASVSGEAGNRGQANYAAAKGALIAATKSLAREMGGRGILSNVVSPGIIETDMTKELPKEKLLEMIPVGRFGCPEEVGRVIKFLLSDDASYINGEVIRVNGGFYT